MTTIFKKKDYLTEFLFSKEFDSLKLTNKYMIRSYMINNLQSQKDSLANYDMIALKLENVMTKELGVIQSIRRTSLKKGYPYYAYGLYIPLKLKNGKTRYKIIASSEEFRSDLRCKRKFNNFPLVENVRDNTLIDEKNDINLPCLF